MNLKGYLWALLALLLTLPGGAQAQTPEKDLFDIPVLTLSKGKYEEFHDQDTVVKIGRVLFNVHTGHIVGFIEQDTLHGDDAFQADIATRWLSPDPLAEEFPSWSPFTYVEDNPIVFVDPDGRASVLPEGLGRPETVNITGGDETIPTPLTTHRLRDIARRNGFPGSGITFNRRVGKAFEELALRSVLEVDKGNTKAYSSLERSRFPGGASSIIPDWVGSVEHSHCDECPMISYPNSMFVEVKAKAGSLTLSTSKQQIRGYLDVAKRSPAGRTPGVIPSIFFVTTSNTLISPSLLSEATRRGVHIYQMIVYERDGKIGFSPPKLLTPDSRLDVPLSLPTEPRELTFPKHEDSKDDPDPEIVE